MEDKDIGKAIDTYENRKKAEARKHLDIRSQKQGLHLEKFLLIIQRNLRKIFLLKISILNRTTSRGKEGVDGDPDFHPA